MEDVLTILSVMAMAKAGLQLSVLKDWKGVIGYVVFVSICVFVMGGYAVDVSREDVLSVVESKAGFDNLSAAVMADFIMTLWFVRARMKKCRMRWARMCPTLLVVPVMFYVYVEVLYAGTGIGFDAIRFGMTIGSCVVLLIIKLLMESVCDVETRAEMIVYVCGMMVVLVVCGMVFHPERSVVGHCAEVDIIQSLWAVVVIVFGVSIGIGYKYVKRYMKWKR